MLVVLHALPLSPLSPLSSYALPLSPLSPFLLRLPRPPFVLRLWLCQDREMSARANVSRLESGDSPEGMWDALGGPAPGVAPGRGAKVHPAALEEEKSFYQSLRVVRMEVGGRREVCVYACMHAAAYRCAMYI